MTMTEQTITDRNILGVTFPAALIEQAHRRAAEVRAILSEAEPILARTLDVYREVAEFEKEAYAAVKLLTDDVHALDGAVAVIAELSGAYALHNALQALASAADPENVSA